jgi:hypothetical protein
VAIPAGAKLKAAGLASAASNRKEAY